MKQTLHDSLNNLRRLAGVTEQPATRVKDLLSKLGQHEAGLISYAGEESDGDCGGTFQEYADPKAIVQLTASATIHDLKTIVDQVASGLGFDRGAFDADVDYWLTDWLPDYEGSLLVVGATGRIPDLGPSTYIYCIKA